MPKPADIAKVASGIYALVKDLDSAERARAVNAALTMLGESLAPAPGTPGGGAAAAASQGGGTKIAATGGRAYFDNKAPNTKIEELAVGARYREEHLSADTHTRDDLEAIIRTEARRNFDRRNFHRDLANAKTAGLFNKSKDIALSYYGQQYVDTLPNREALAALRKPKGGRKARKAKKAKAAK